MTPPRLTVVDDYDALSRTAATAILDVVSASPAPKVIAATGETPIGVYRELVQRSTDGTFDSSGMIVYILDEYVGGPADGRGSLTSWLRRTFVDPLGIPDTRVVGLPGDGDPAACAGYDLAIADRGGFDLVILGIGVNGHIGFNEPPSEASSPTRLVTLSEDSLLSNQRYRDDGTPVPRTAVTVGMAPLLASHACILLASGSSKADVLQRALDGPIGPELPASFLQQHANVHVIADRAAWPEMQRA